MHTRGLSASSSPTMSPLEQNNEFATRFLTPRLQKMSSAAIQCSVYGFYNFKKGHDSEILRRHLTIVKSIVSIFTVVLLYRKLFCYLCHLVNMSEIPCCSSCPREYKMRQHWLGRTPTLIFKTLVATFPSVLFDSFFFYRRICLATSERILPLLPHMSIRLTECLLNRCCLTKLGYTKRRVSFQKTWLCLGALDAHFRINVSL